MCGCPSNESEMCYIFSIKILYNVVSNAFYYRYSAIEHQDDCYRCILLVKDVQTLYPSKGISNAVIDFYIKLVCCAIKMHVNLIIIYQFH